MLVLADDNTTVLGSYTYGDSNERLIAEEGGLRTYYACDGSAEYVESGGSTTPQWSKTYIYLGARLLSTFTPNGSGGEFVQYHHPDRLGTRLVTNGQDTTYFEQVSLPFGTALNAESTGSTNRRFTSYDRSAATGLDYALNRHYDPQQGRFTQVDPIGMNATSLGDPQSLNMYAYCGNDPVNHIDPDGLFWGKLWRAIKKVITSKWFIIAVTVALIVITIGSSAFGWQLARAVLTNIGGDAAGEAIMLPLGQTVATTLGWVASGLQAALAVGSISFSAKAILGNAIGIAAGIGFSRVLGSLGGVVGLGGTPDWNPNANQLQAPGGGTRPRGPRGYPTIDAAAAAALRRINRRSRREDREYAGRICQSGGRYLYTPAVRGTVDSSDPNASPCATGTTTVSGYHTHGGFNRLYDSERFSNILNPVTGLYDGDIPFANADGHPFYVATPSRRMRVYDPATGRTRTLRGRTP